MKKCTENKLLVYTVSLTIAITILLDTKSFGQLAEKKIVNKDAMSAIEIRDSVIHPCIPSKGHMSMYWYKYIPEKDTLLIFDIVPIDRTHAYDFSVYKYEKVNNAGIKNRKLKGVRKVDSHDHYNQSGPRGLSPSAKRDTMLTREGYVYGYVRPLAVKAGDTCYIEVVWQYSNSWQKGFKLYLYNYWPDKPKHLLSKPVIKSKEIVLENVLFETNKSTLLKESYAPLDSLAQMLSSQKTINIEIKGHTDNVGEEIKNQELSEKRAKAVFDYLVSKKIAQNRLSYRGLGSKEPITSNEREEGRKKNRRVAFIVIAK